MILASLQCWAGATRGRGVMPYHAFMAVVLCTIDDRIPSLPGREHVHFSQFRQTLLAPSAECRVALGESHEG